MAELKPLDGLLNGAGALGGADGLGGGPTTVTPPEAVVTAKRQRRPSVRLGEIGGDQFYESHHRRSNSNSSKQWKHHQDPSKSSKTRALTNFTAERQFPETLADGKEANLDSVASIGGWKVRETKKRASNATTKRVRSNWVTKIEDSGCGNSNNIDEDEEYSGGDTYCDFDMENSDSPIHSPENLGDGNERNDREMYCNRSIRVRENQNYHHDGVELSGPSETDFRECRYSVDGVRIWLNSIGLGRYAPVFEIHEVDDEVLPMLTLEDLKDMGINAVGSRRKMFCAIQKLGKGFS